MTHTPRLLIGLVVAIGLVVGSLAGGLLTGVGSSTPARAATTAAAGLEETALGIPTGRDTALAIARLERELEQTRSATSLRSLGVAFQLRWRETGDATYLPRSEAALREAERLSPDDPTVALGLGSLALIRHEFTDALALGRRASRLAPASSAPHGVIGDALVELGRYREAFAAFERMVALRPTVAGYARIAYARELLGDRSGAAAAMRLALDAAGGVPEPTAWTLVELGKLELGGGHVRRAETALREALQVLPGYVQARAPLARVRAAQGDLAGAVREARRASDAIPLPATVALLADLLERQGRTEQARRQQRIAAASLRLLAANGVRSDLDDVLLRADRGLAPARTVALARSARAARPSIVGDDALGWALARAGRCTEAERWLDRSLRLGTRDALLFFHRAYAARCAGDEPTMRRFARAALALDPHFSIRWAPVARRMAR